MTELSDLERYLQASQKRLQRIQEEARRTTGPDPLLAASIYEISMSLEEVHVAVEELHQQNEELLATRQTIEAERQRYQNLFHFAPDAYLVTNGKGVIQAANRAAETLFQVRQEWLVGKPLTLYIAEGDRPFVDAQLDRHFQAPSSPTDTPVPIFFQDREVSVQPRDRDPIPTSLALSGEYDAQGKLVQLCWLFRDLTERKRAEAEQRGLSESLQTSEANLRQILEGAIVAVGTFAAYPDGTFVNQTLSVGCEGVYGYTAAELQADPGLWSSRLWPEDRETLFSTFFERIATETSLTLEYRFLDKTDTLRWISETFNAQWDEEAACWQVTVVATNITQHKQVEEALRESERRYAILTRTVPVSIFRFDTAGQCTYVNPAWSDLTGRPAEAALGRGWVQAMHPDDQDAALHSVTQWMESGELDTPYRYEGRVVRPNGDVRWFYAQILPDLNEQGALVGYVGSLTDITDRKQAELALQHSEARSRAMLTAIPDLMIRIGADGIYREMVTTQYHLHVVSEPLGCIGRSITEMLPPDIADRACFHLQRALQSGELQVYEQQVPMGDRQQFEEVRVIKSGDDEALFMIRDISDRKRAEAEVWRREQRYQQILNAIPDLIFVKDSDSLMVWGNRAFLAYYGMTLEELQGIIDAPFSPADHTRQYLQDDSVVFTTRQTLDIPEEPITRHDGEVRCFRTTKSPIFDEDGQVSLLVGICRDITDRREAELALKHSEEKFRHFADNSQAVIWIADPTSLDNLYISPAYERVWGRSCQSLKEKPDSWMDSIHPDDRDRVQAKMAQQRQGKPSSTEYRIIRPDGSIRWIWDWGFAIRDEAGEVYRYGGIAEDITERKLAEQKIREQAALIDIATDAFIVRDLEDRILFWSQGAERLYGWSRDEAMGHRAHELFGQALKAELETGLQTTVEHGSWQGELSKQTRSGDKMLVASRWTLVRDEAGQSLSILSVDTDITEQKMLADQVLQAQRLESLGRLASGIAHDLNNVLTPILTMAQLLRMTQKNADHKILERLRLLEDSAKRGAGMVRQMLTLTRGSTGERTTVALTPLLQEVVNMAHQSFPKSIRIRLKLPPADGSEPSLARVLADTTHLHQVFMNLCINGRDAMPDGGDLTITAENVYVDEAIAQVNLDAQVGNYVVVTVADTGTGIEPEVRDRMFDPFFTTKEPGKGTGLGLATVLGIVKNHGGFLQVFTEVGQGTQIKVYLPALEPADPAAEPSEDAPENGLTGRGETVLIVEDDVAVQQTTEALLESHHYTTLLASDGIEAIAQYTQHQADIQLVVLDITMPNMDGIELVRNLKIINPTIKIIAISGLPTNRAPVLAAGANAFLAKPYPLDELLHTVHDLINQD